jgi:AmmeMemoRadiSam system protein B
VAETYYPAETEALKATVDELLELSIKKEPEGGRLMALVSPHAGSI